MTDLEGLEKLVVPSDLTNEQIREMFRLVLNVAYAQATSGRRRHIIPHRVDELTGWFMAQNFQYQIVNYEL